jgi:hypothetical protein
MSVYGRTPGYMLPAEAVMPAGQVVKFQPVAIPPTRTPVSAAPAAFGAGGPFSAAQFFSTYISCANWMSMSAATRTSTMAGYFASVQQGGRSTRYHLGPTSQYPSWGGPLGQQTFRNGTQSTVGQYYLIYTAADIAHAVLTANAYCAAQNPQHYMVPTNVRPAGQAVTTSSGISAWTVIAILAGGFILYEIGSYYLGKTREDIHRGRRAHYRY